MNKWLIVSIILASTFLLAQPAVIGIDFGSDFFQISLIMPGKSFVIVENSTSKRKTNNAISFLGKMREYESDAVNKRLKNPKNTFVFLNKFLGAVRQDQQVFEVAKQFYEEYQMQFNQSKGTVDFVLDKSYFPFQNEADNQRIVLRVEEVMAMILKYAKSISERQASGSVKDCVVTVPSYFTLNQRKMLHQAIKISGLNALSFVNENTAAAVYYIINRGDQNQTTNIIYYNIGSTGIQATLVEYSMTNFTSKTTNKKIPNINILADSGFPNYGSAEMDRVLANHFAQEIDAMPSRKGKTSIKTNRRAMVKLIKECTRLKQVLSANKEAQFFVEGLVDGSDFKSQIDRTTFENKNQHIFDVITKPIDQILALANQTIDDISLIELVGGGVRVPKIIDVLQKHVGQVQVGQHLNGDECFALGAGFIAANMSHGFRVRDIHLNDGYNFDVYLKVKNLDQVPEDHPDYYNKSTILFPRKRQFGSQRLINFNYAKNIRLEVESVDDQGRVSLLSQYNLTNITNITDYLTNPNFTSPQIHVQFVLSPFTGVELENVEAWVNETKLVEIQVQSKQNTTNTKTEIPQDDQKKKKDQKKKEQSSDDDDSDDDEDQVETQQNNQENKDGEFSSKYSSKQNKKQRILEQVTPDDDASANQPAQKIQQKIVEHYYEIAVNSWSSILPYMNETEVAESQKQIQLMQEVQDQIRKHAEAQNRLESFIYEMKGIVSEREFEKCSTQSQREALTQHAEQTDEWLNSDEGSDSSVSEYRERITKLNDTAKPVLIRIQELQLRQSAVNKTAQNLEEYRKQFNQMKQSMTWLTEEQQEPLEKLLGETEVWFMNVTTLQSERAPYEDPLFTSTELFHQVQDIKSELIQLKHIKKPKVQKAENEDSTSGEEGELKEGQGDEEGNTNTDQQKKKQAEVPPPTDNDENFEIPPYDENQVRNEDEDL